MSQMGKVVQEVRTVFERLNDTTIYIPFIFLKYLSLKEPSSIETTLPST